MDELIDANPHNYFLVSILHNNALMIRSQTNAKVRKDGEQGKLAVELAQTEARPSSLRVCVKSN